MYGCVGYGGNGEEKEVCVCVCARWCQGTVASSSHSLSLTLLLPRAASSLQLSLQFEHVQHVIHSFTCLYRAFIHTAAYS